jgi:hypothetical protein
MLFSDKIHTKFHNKIDDEADIYFQKIVKASERMQQLVNDLLKFSKHAHDKFGFEKTDLNEVLNEVLSDVEYHIQKKEARIYADKLPVIWGVPSQMRQLFQNLISNSLKFAKENIVPEIHISSEKIEPPSLNGDTDSITNVFHKIYIRDNGIGFDPKYAEDIFVVFKRLHSYHEFEGTGIGLSICKKIVDKHNGYIKAESAPSIGSTFIITLPEKNNMWDTNSVKKQTMLL